MWILILTRSCHRVGDATLGGSAATLRWAAGASGGAKVVAEAVWEMAVRAAR